MGKSNLRMLITFTLRKSAFHGRVAYFLSHTGVRQTVTISDSLLTRLQPTSYVTNSRGTQNRSNQQMAIFASGLRGAPEHCKNGNSNTMPSPAGPNALFRRRRADSAWHREADPAS